jgi:hypothetical protein
MMKPEPSDCARRCAAATLTASATAEQIAKRRTKGVVVLDLTPLARGDVDHGGLELGRQIGEADGALARGDRLNL